MSSMMNKDSQKPNRIPVRFVDDEGKGGGTHGDAGAGGLTPEEIGRESSYEDETEVGRRIDRGTEGPGGRGAADDADAAGGPDPSELPERREDQDTNPSHRQSDGRAREAAAGADADDSEAARNAGALGGPQLAELIATRAELKRVQTELVRLMAERGELLDKFTRRQADFDNYRKRVERERGETYNRAAGEVVGQLLPVIDNLRRALDAEATVQAGESEEFRHFLQGVELINRQLGGVLDTLGVKPVLTVGQPFDPHVHEAVAAEESERHAPDTVIEELTRGYRLGDKLIRPAQVKVAK
jgi:molecular chaperone GrpE